MFPVVSEITSNNDVFLRPNVVEGKYRSVDDYLDIQFRLLREDFVAPLRQGILDYSTRYQGDKRKKIFDVKFYPQSQFIKSQTLNDKVIRIVRFNKDPKKIKMKFENNKRFMYGSLVCFTNDHFQRIIFGTVAERNIDLLKQGQIGVHLVNNDFEYEKDYLMIECSVYFEPYYHVLKALQNMDTESFPLEEYIIHVHNEPVPPAYVTVDTLMTIPTIRNDANVRVLSKDSWPTKRCLGLDESQYNALKAALTREFCVIQGPPGTGKTYIGLRITEILLDNSKLWNTGPILVICFTNHALDQFLEGILTYTEKIVRIGGQSKTEKLKPFNIRELRYKERRNKLVNDNLKMKLSVIKSQMLDIRTIQNMIDTVKANDRIINIKIFDKIDKEFENSWFSRAKSEDFIEWLFGGGSEKQRYKERRNMRIREAQNDDESEDDSDELDEEFFDADDIERIIDDSDNFEDITVELSTVYKLTLKTLSSFEQNYNHLLEEYKLMENIPDDSEAVFDPKEAKLEEIIKAENAKIYLQVSITIIQEYLLKKLCTDVNKYPIAVLNFLTNLSV